MHRSGSDSIKQFRKGDFWLLLVFILAALLAAAFLSFTGTKGSAVIVTVDGHFYGSYPLNEECKIIITPSHGSRGRSGSKEEDFTNTLVIKNGFAEMTGADCPDQICVKHRPVHKTGETIICLPHKVIVRITGDDSSGSDQVDAAAE